MKLIIFVLEIILGLVLVWGGADLGPDTTRIICGIMVTCFILVLIIPNKPRDPEKTE